MQENEKSTPSKALELGANATKAVSDVKKLN